jgi:hypothetical protein
VSAPNGVIEVVAILVVEVGLDGDEPVEQAAPPMDVGDVRLGDLPEGGHGEEECGDAQGRRGLGALVVGISNSCVA